MKKIPIMLSIFFITLLLYGQETGTEEGNIESPQKETVKEETESTTNKPIKTEVEQEKAPVQPQPEAVINEAKLLAQIDAERMCFFLERDQHIITFNPNEADAIIINTCGFIEKAKKENINIILDYVQIKKERPGIKIILSGCLTERYKTDLLESLPKLC